MFMEMYNCVKLSKGSLPIWLIQFYNKYCTLDISNISILKYSRSVKEQAESTIIKLKYNFN